MQLIRYESTLGESLPAWASALLLPAADIEIIQRLPMLAMWAERLARDFPTVPAQYQPGYRARLLELDDTLNDLNTAMHQAVGRAEPAGWLRRTGTSLDGLGVAPLIVVAIAGAIIIVASGMAAAIILATMYAFGPSPIVVAAARNAETQMRNYLAQMQEQGIPIPPPPLDNLPDSAGGSLAKSIPLVLLALGGLYIFTRRRSA